MKLLQRNQKDSLILEREIELMEKDKYAKAFNQEVKLYDNKLEYSFGLIVEYFRDYILSESGLNRIGSIILCVPQFPFLLKYDLSDSRNKTPLQENIF